MPLYQLFCISVHAPEYSRIKTLVTQTAKHVMNDGGVVRHLDSWGTLVLPQRMKRHKQFHTYGDYWMMHFDTSPRNLSALNTILKQDPLVIRWTVLKLGSKVEDIATIGQKLLHQDETS